MGAIVKFIGSGRGTEDSVDHLAVIGTKGALARADVVAALPAEVGGLWGPMVESLSPGDQFAATTTWVARGGAAMKISALAISDRASRHNAPSRPDAVAAALKGRFTKGHGQLLVALERSADAAALTCAVARAFPTYMKKRKTEPDLLVEVRFLVEPALPTLNDEAIARLATLAESVRDAGRLTDMPPSELHTDAFVAEAEALARRLGVPVKVLRLAELERVGMGGLVGVGQASTREPALVHLRWDPAAQGLPSSGAPMAWVGKGIVYDTGGLSMKGKTDMPGMKVDMGGAASVLSAFRVAVETRAPRRIDAILCIAENSVGPSAMRPDDVITLYSGKTIEVNNTDAEGRLVLADGVAYAVKDCEAKVIIDLATLTGAQLMSTGKLHAGIVSNDEALEIAAVRAGRQSGDLCFPLPYAPELFRGEFSSPVADLRNSVKDRMNAQSSCAAQFIAESLSAATPAGANVRWLHVDMAGPVVARERGTGFGVGLLTALAASPD
jgi:probable aminopeptidase NPEPL1